MSEDTAYGDADPADHHDSTSRSAGESSTDLPDVDVIAADIHAELNTLEPLRVAFRDATAAEASAAAHRKEAARAYSAGMRKVIRRGLVGTELLGRYGHKDPIDRVTRRSGSKRTAAQHDTTVPT